MKKWKKRILLSLVSLLGGILGGALVLLWLLRGTPDWYRPDAITAEQREAAAQRATNKLAMVQNEAARLRRDERFARAGDPASAASGPAAAQAITLTLSDDEINAFFEKWSVWQNVRRSYERFLGDPSLVLRDGRLILAGRIKDLDTVASLHFDPQIDEQGRLDLKLVRVLGGKLPLPDAIFERYRRKAAASVQNQVNWARTQAAIDGSGLANSSAITAVLGKLLLDVLDQRPAEPVLFLPLVERGCIPVKVLDVKVEDRTLTLVVAPMSAGQRAELLRQIRAGLPAGIAADAR